MQIKTVKDTTWGFLAVLMLVFLYASYSLIQRQSQLNDVVDDSNQIEYLSSSTQRMVRLVLNGQGDQALMSYLDEETKMLLKAGTDTSVSVLTDERFQEMAELVLYNWDVILELINAEELDTNTLLLAADNHFYQMTNLADEIKEHATTLSHRVADIQYRIGLLLLILSIIIFNNFMKTRAELRDKKEQAKMALIDSATGLYNRSKCHELFKATYDVGKEKQQAIIVFDLNDLKKTNDFRGHRMGDELIRSFANLLKSSAEIHVTAPFIGRYGGDEFIVYYDDLPTEGDLHYFLKELATLTKDFNENESRFQVSYAHGYKIAVGDENKTLSVRAMFDLADEFMYENKKVIKAEKEDDFEGNTQSDGNISAKNMEMDSNQEENPEEVTDYDKISSDRNLATQRKTGWMVAATLLAVGLYLVGYTSVKSAKETYINDNILHLAVGNGFDQLERQAIGNPWNNGNVSSMLTFRALFTPNTDFSDVTPDLASAYKVSEDGLTYEITLKENIFWSDGEAITIDDVIFSFESFLLCGNGNVNLSTAFNKISGASDLREGKSTRLEGLEVNGNVLTIRLDSPHNSFMQMLAQFVPLPQHILSYIDVTTITSDIDFFYEPVTSGMYMVEGMDENSNLVLVQNPHYNEPVSDIEKVLLLWDYQNERLDFYGTSNITQMVSYRAMRGMDEYTVDVHFYRYFVYNLAGGYDAKTVAELEAEALLTDEEKEALKLEKSDENDQDDSERGINEVMQDVRIRQAISHAINRPQLLSDLYFDTGSLTAGGPASESTEEVYGYNPQKARQLLEEANYDFDRVFTIAYYHSDATTYIFLQQVKAYLEAVGLTVEIVKADTGNQFMYEDREFDMLLKGLSSFDTADWYNEFLSTNGNMSALMGDKGEFDDLVTDLSEATSATSYRETLNELMYLEQDLLYKLPLFTLNESIYVRESRLSVPNDIIFTNTRYRSDLRLDEWYIKKA